MHGVNLAAKWQHIVGELYICLHEIKKFNLVTSKQYCLNTDREKRSDVGLGGGGVGVITSCLLFKKPVPSMSSPTGGWE